MSLAAIEVLPGPGATTNESPEEHSGLSTFGNLLEQI